MSVLAALDRFVHVTRLDILNPRPGARRRVRNLRWLPLPILIAMPAGYALFLVAIDHVVPLLWGAAGMAIFQAGFIGANVIRWFGPRLVAESGQQLDEREQMVKARAGSISGIAIALLLALGCLYCGYAAGLGGWMPRRPFEWIFLALVIEGWTFALPVLVASWLQPRPDRDEE